MTPKTMKSNGRRANGAQIERKILDRTWSPRVLTSYMRNLGANNITVWSRPQLLSSVVIWALLFAKPK
jgi:hypothetical protein